MDITLNLNNFTSHGFVFDEIFIKSEEALTSCPFLNQMKYFLSLIGNGIELNERHLPQETTDLFCKEYESNKLMVSGSYFEEGAYMCATRVKNVAIDCSLVSLDNNTMTITAKGKWFLGMSDSHQFIFLLDQYGMEHHIGFYDRYKGGEFIQAIFLTFLSIIIFSEKPVTLRESCNILYEKYPSFKNLIRDGLTAQYGEDKKELFIEIVQLRIIKRFFGLFNLIENDKDFLKPSQLLLQILPKADK